MKQKLPISLRLTTPPAIAALAVVFLAGLSLVDLSRNRKAREPEHERRVQVLDHPRPRTVPLTEDVPNLSEEEALKSFKEFPSRAAAMRLWPLPVHREALFKSLLSRQTGEEVRLYLLGAFELASPAKALEAARAIVGERALGEGPLLISSLEILARHGERGDLALFAQRPGESHQLKTLREEYRDLLQSKAH